jgi:uncharacterized cupin superfamily protein
MLGDPGGDDPEETCTPTLRSAKVHKTNIVANVHEMTREERQIAGTGELLGIVAPLTQGAGLRNLRVEHEVLRPGRRASSPHAHTKQEECVLVLAGHADLWIDGELHPMGPGDYAAFPAGTGVSHTLLNNSNEDVEVLVVAALTEDDVCFYPLGSRPSDAHEGGPPSWRRRSRGPHDGRPTLSQRADESA